MQHASNLVNLQKFQQTSSSRELKLNAINTNHQSSKVNLPSTDNADRVWGVFTQIYGRGFITEFGELPNDIWIEELAKFSPRDIEFGIEQCKRSGSNFAPRLPQFLAYCTPPMVEDVYRQERESQNLISRPKWQGNDAVRIRELAKYREQCKLQQPQEAA